MLYIADAEAIAHDYSHVCGIDEDLDTAIMRIRAEYKPRKFSADKVKMIKIAITNYRNDF